MAASVMALREAIETRLDDYFSELLRSGEVSPAARFKLEGFLQAGLVVNAISEPDLAGLMQSHIAAFNSGSGLALQLQSQEEAWHLPYQAPVAPVK